MESTSDALLASRIPASSNNSLMAQMRNAISPMIGPSRGTTLKIGRPESLRDKMEAKGCLWLEKTDIQLGE